MIAEWNLLVEEAKELLGIAEKIQNEEQSQQKSEASLKKLDEKYHQWYRAALVLFDKYQQPGQRRLFEQEYSGNIWYGKIIKFLTSGLEANPLYIPNNPLTDKWTYPFKMNFKEPLLKQCNILASLETASQTAIRDKSDDDWNETICRILKVFIEKANNASTTNEKKLTYEYLAIFLIGAIEGLSVLGQDVRGASEEIDLWVTNESQDGFWQRIGHLFIVESKNWSEPVGAQQVRILKSIMRDKNIGFAILLAKNGITGDDWHDAVDTIRKAIKDHVYIVVLDHTDLLEIANGMHPTKKIKQKYYDLLMRS